MNKTTLTTMKAALCIGVLFILNSTPALLFALQDESPCDINVAAQDSIAVAIDNASAGDVICLATALWEESLDIDKSLVLRGEGSENSIIQGSASKPEVLVISGDDAVQVDIVGIAIQGSALDGVGIGIVGLAQANLTSILVENNNVGIFVGDEANLILNGSSIVNNTQISDPENEEVVATGIRFSDSSSGEVNDSRIENNGRFGILLTESGSVRVVDSLIVLNDIGIAGADNANIEIDDSNISENGEQGVGFLGSSSGIVENSVLDRNGTAPVCQLPGDEGGEICNGIFLKDSPSVTLRNVSIVNNADWGIAASIKVCGYREDEYSGNINLEGGISISGNNQSGNHSDDGNPGAHPFGTLIDGQVCLP